MCIRDSAYNIYAVLLTISTAGLPVAVSKLVSEANATGRQNQVRRVFRLSLALFLTPVSYTHLGWQRRRRGGGPALE